MDFFLSWGPGRFFAGNRNLSGKKSCFKTPGEARGKVSHYSIPSPYRKRGGVMIPDWLREIALAVGAFIGGKTISAIGEARKESRDMREGMIRLAVGVEAISKDLNNIRGEIHEQVSGLKKELHEQQTRNELRMQNVEDKIENVNLRIDSITSAEGVLIRRGTGQKERLAWERSCKQDPENVG